MHGNPRRGNTIARFHMRSIFWKIFLWFWLAIALVAGADFATMLLTRPADRVRALHFVQTWLPLQAEHAVNLYERGSPDSLAAFLREIAKPSDGNAALYLPNGLNVLGPAATPEIAALVRQAAGSTEIVSNASNGHEVFAQSIWTSSGQKYVYCAELPHPPFIIMMLQAPVHTQFTRLAVVLMVAAVVCLWLAHHITFPILRLQRVARSIAAGQLDIRIHPQPVRRRDEIADLERDFDLMAERLETLMTSQQRLLQAISHELRSPLARLNVAVGLARQRPNEDQRVHLDRIEREAGSLNEMISQMLALFREEHSGAVATQGILDLSSIVSDVVADARFEASSVNRSVVVTRTEPCFVRGNDRLLRSAIENVVRNAIRYTRERSSVEVAINQELCEERPLAILRVVDHGCGVPEEALTEIFQPFFRLHDARERETGGTGLGLAITDHAIRLHGGSVSAQNGDDGGLVVVFHLPLAPDSNAIQKSFPTPPSIPANGQMEPSIG
jgi:two-component system sensor histidine kinase CpxA